MSRIAVISTDLPMVRQLFLVGTPNKGAVSTTQLVLFSQVAQLALGKILTHFPRKQGIYQLTAAARLFSERATVEAAQRASKVDYISIPGLYFHGHRAIFDFNITSGLQWTYKAIQLWSQVFRSFAIEMPRPHDGIVTEKSNSLIPFGEPGARTEKDFGDDRPHGIERRYVHFRPQAADQLDHVSVQRSPDVFALVLAIIETGDLAEFVRSMDLTSRQLYQPVDEVGSA